MQDIISFDMLRARFICTAYYCMHVFVQDTLRLETPGGGGYGEPTETVPAAKRPRVNQFTTRGSLANYQRTQESA